MRACVDGFRPVEQFFVVIAEVPLNCRILVSFFVKNTRLPWESLVSNRL